MPSTFETQQSVPASVLSLPQVYFLELGSFPRDVMNGTVSASALPEKHQFSLSTTVAGFGVSLECAALRYPVSQGGLTLILTHGIAGCKEQYHTTITRLLSLQHSATYHIREVWAIDFPNHGEAATLNRRLLEEYKANCIRQGINGVCTIMDLAAYLYAFLSLPRFRGHEIVGMGHSGSCTTWIHALTKFDHVYPNTLILVEPTVMFPGMSPTDPRSIHGAANVRGALTKRNAWSSRAELKSWLIANGRKTWARWDPRALDLYVEHAFEEIAASEGHGPHVTFKIRRDEESPLYECFAHTIEPCQLATMCTSLEAGNKRGMHIVWAEFEEFISKTAKADILDAAQHRIATQRTVMGSGHSVPQLKPDALGDAVHEVLGLIGSATKSLL